MGKATGIRTYGTREAITPAAPVVVPVGATVAFGKVPTVGTVVEVREDGKVVVAWPNGTTGAYSAERLIVR